MTNHPSHKGAILKEFREAKGIALETVHEETKIPLDVLRAIEDGYTVRNISPFYLKGFMKMYAQYLNVDAGDIVDDYQKERLPPTIKQEVKEFEFQEWLRQLLSPKRMRQIVLGAGVLGILFLAVKVTASFIQRRSSSVTQTAAPLPGTPPQAAPADQDVVALGNIKVQDMMAKAPAVASSTSPPPPAPAAVKKNITLTVRAKRESWLRVKADGNVVFQATLGKGAVETWNANKEIEIAGRNINSLEFELNGKLIGSLGREGSSAKKVLVTKDGLSVMK